MEIGDDVDFCHVWCEIVRFCHAKAADNSQLLAPLSYSCFSFLTIFNTTTGSKHAVFDMCFAFQGGRT